MVGFRALQSLPAYLHQIPALQGLGDDGGHGGADAAKDHQVFGAVADGVEEGPQPLGVVTLQRGKEAESEKGGRNQEQSRVHEAQPALPSWLSGVIFIPLLMLFLDFLNYPQMLRQGGETTKTRMLQP